VRKDEDWLDALRCGKGRQYQGDKDALGSYDLHCRRPLHAEPVSSKAAAIDPKLWWNASQLKRCEQEPKTDKMTTAYSTSYRSMTIWMWSTPSLSHTPMRDLPIQTSKEAIKHTCSSSPTLSHKYGNILKAPHSLRHSIVLVNLVKEGHTILSLALAPTSCFAVNPNS